MNCQIAWSGPSECPPPAPLRTTARIGSEFADKDSVFVCEGCHHKIPQPGWLKQRKFILSWFWRLQVHSKVSAGLASAASLPGLQRATFSRLHTLIPVCLRVSDVSLALSLPLCLNVLFFEGYQSH